MRASDGAREAALIDDVDVADTVVEAAYEPPALGRRQVPTGPPFPGFVDLSEDTDHDMQPWFAREAEVLRANPLPARLARERTPRPRTQTMTRPYDPPVSQIIEAADIIDDEPRWEDLGELLASAGDRL